VNIFKSPAVFNWICTDAILHANGIARGIASRCGFVRPKARTIYGYESFIQIHILPLVPTATIMSPFNPMSTAFMCSSIASPGPRAMRQPKPRTHLLSRSHFLSVFPSARSLDWVVTSSGNSSGSAGNSDVSIGGTSEALSRWIVFWWATRTM
jgi:hypothetical protein